MNDSIPLNKFEKPCESCKHLYFYPEPYETYVCTHAKATGVGHSAVTGKEQPSYTAASVFYRAECKGTLKEVKK